MRKWVDVAVLAKSRNLDGRFVAYAAAGLPFLLEEGDSVWFVPPKLDVPRSATVESVSPIDENHAEIKFAGIDDADVAGELVGMHCLLDRSLIDEAELENAPALWEGWLVVDESDGVIGDVVGVIDNPSQSLIEVAHEGATVLVPIVDEIVKEIDVDAGRILVNLPKGLLDLS